MPLVRLRYWGVSILISKNLQFSVLNPLSDPEERFLFINCVINEVNYTLASLYAPNVNQLLFLNQTFCKLMEFKTGEILLGGDLNYVCNPILDRAKVTIQSKPGFIGDVTSTSRIPRHYNFYKTRQSKLSELFGSYDLVDTWRALYPSARQYTYFSSSHGACSHTDFLFTSKTLFNSVVSADIGLRSLSDHAWVRCLIRCPTPAHLGWD